nr:RNA-dependent RNA polymerase, eukaryotic-type [Tanacetum cinerariifolium]
YACYVFPDSKKLIHSPYSPSITKTIPEDYPFQKQHLDWDSEKTYLYHCHVSIDGTYHSRELGDDNVLILQFTDDLDPDMPFDQQSWFADRQTISNKIFIGRRKLEDVVYVQDAIDIISMKIGPMFDFEAKILAKYGRANCEPSDRVMVHHLDPDMPFDQQRWIAARHTISDRISIGSRSSVNYTINTLSSPSSLC